MEQISAVHRVDSLLSRSCQGRRAVELLRAPQYLAFFMVAQTCHNSTTYIQRCQTCQRSKA